MNLKQTKTLVGMGILTAIVVVLQVLSMYITFGPFNITLALTPIIIGAALYGWQAGAVLGAVMGIVVLITNAQAFLAVSVVGTIITCILKSALAGLAAGMLYSLLAGKNRTVAVVTAAFVTPIVNTGVFLLGCLVFFLDTIKSWAGSDSVAHYMIFGLVGANFLIELGVNLALASAIVRILDVVLPSRKAARKAA
ncbi:MAG: ECF transporter S component [Ruminococcus sp.]|nr:ECF transporter S component [Ruminococcus sp.]